MPLVQRAFDGNLYEEEEKDKGRGVDVQERHCGVRRKKVASGKWYRITPHY